MSRPDPAIYFVAAVIVVASAVDGCRQDREIDRLSAAVDSLRAPGTVVVITLPDSLSGYKYVRLKVQPSDTAKFEPHMAFPSGRWERLPR